MGDPFFLPASPHIVPTSWTCSCLTHRVNGLVMGLQRLLMKRRFCLHTRAMRHFTDNSDCGSSAIAKLPHHSASGSTFSPSSVQITQKRRRWGLILAGRCVALADWQSSESQGYYSAGRSLVTAYCCLDVQPALNGHYGFSPWGQICSTSSCVTRPSPSPRQQHVIPLEWRLSWKPWAALVSSCCQPPRHAGMCGD